MQLAVTCLSSIKKSIFFIGLTTALVITTDVGQAQATAFTDADKAVEYRQQGLQLIRENFAFMASMVRGDREYDAEMFEQRAVALSHAVFLPWDGFQHAGENYQGNGDTLPAAWENWDDFSARTEQLQADARQLAELATSGDMNEIRPLFMQTARNCQQCHDRYREDK